MIQTSQQYKDAVVKGTRSSTAKIYFGVYDVTAKDDASPSVNSSQPFVSLNNIIDNVRIPEFKMATFEDDYFTLDGSFYLTPDDVGVSDTLGWISQVMSDSSGVFSTIPTITVLFDDLHSSLGIGLYFDPLGGSCASSFDVTWYNGASVIGYELVDNNIKTSYNIEKSVENYNKIVIRFLKTSSPYRYARLTEVNFGLEKTFDGDTIISASMIEEVDPSGGVLSVNTLKFTVSNEDQKFNMLNPDGIYSFLQKRQQIVAMSELMLDNGSTEEIPLGTFYLSDWKNSTGMTATLQTTDALGLMDKTMYYSSPFWVNEPLTNVISHILNDAGNFPFTMGVELNGELINGYIPILSHREALQYLLMSARATLRINRDGIFTIFRPDYNTIQESIDYDTIIGTPTIEQKPLITSVNVTEYSFTLNASTEQIYQSTFTLVGTSTLVIPYDSPAANASLIVTGLGAISGVVKYSVTSAIVTIIGTGSLTVTITGKKYVESTHIVTASLGVLSAGELPQVATVADCKLLCGNALAVAQNILNYNQKRIKQTINYWDNPAIQAGDCVNVETMFGTNKSGIIEKHEITFVPFLKGKLEVTG